MAGDYKLFLEHAIRGNIRRCLPMIFEFAKLEAEAAKLRAMPETATMAASAASARLRRVRGLDAPGQDVGRAPSDGREALE